MAAESQICHYRRVRLLPGLRVNLSRSGASVSIGWRGAWLTAGSRRPAGDAPLAGKQGSVGPSGFHRRARRRRGSA